MFYSRKVAPECANAIRKLAQCMDHPGIEQWKYLTRLMGYFKYSPYTSLLLRKPTKLQVISWVDSNLAQGITDRVSITGGITTLGGQLLSHVSKKQDGVSLLSTEAEYKAMSVLAQDVMFCNMLLEELVGEAETPVLYEDNTGAIFLS